jgi:hypothetical protein
MPVPRVRGERPDDPEWRADALAGSRHSRLADELREPLDDHDAERSRALCAEVTRQVLLDFAPALIPLPREERERAQALTAFALTLFDFALQSGLEGERLSQINRWEFNLDLALEGRPPGQPVFVQLARLGATRAWPRPALEELVAVARRRATVPPRTPDAARAARGRLAEALCSALLPEDPDEDVRSLARALFDVRALQSLGEGLRRGEPTGGAGTPEELERSIVEQVSRLRGELADRSGLRALPATYRRSGAYLRRAALGILAAVERRGPKIVDQPPRLGAGARIGALLAALITGR